MHYLVDHFLTTKNWQRFEEEIGGQREISVHAPSYVWPLLLAGLFKSSPGHLLALLPSVDEADKLQDDLSVFLEESKMVYFPPRENLPSEELSPHRETSGNRNKVLYRLKSEEKLLALTSARAVMDRLPSPQDGVYFPLSIKEGDQIPMEEIVDKLNSFDYKRTERTLERGDYSVRGGIVDVFGVTSEYPCRVELFGDVVESIRSFSPATQRSRGRLKEVEIFSCREILGQSGKVKLFDEEGYFHGIERFLPLFHQQTSTLFAYPGDDLDDGSTVVFIELVEIRRKFQEDYDLTVDLQRHKDPDQMNLLFSATLAPEELTRAFSGRKLYLSSFPKKLPSRKTVSLQAWPQQSFGGDLEKFTSAVRDDLDKGQKIIISLKTPGRAERIREVLGDENISFHFLPQEVDLDKVRAPIIEVTSLSEGFVLPGGEISIYTEREIFGQVMRVPRLRRIAEGAPLARLSDIKKGDYVVHLNHGIGKYGGLVQREIDGIRRDYFLLEYDRGDRLYVPASQIQMIQAYVGEEEPTIHRLGSVRWSQIKRRVKSSVRELARELLSLYAAREQLEGFAFPQDTVWQRELEDTFPYEETPDQLRAIQDVKKDMEKPKPMDRLICGDVGYGKTEVALRAAFKAVTAGKQVLFLVPTTVLAQQHHATFSSRLAPFPIRVEVMSRLRSPQEQKKVLDGLADGAVDIAVGTHRLLQEDVRVKDLGLVIIDEEQRFGVMHKEKLKMLRKVVDVVTLTATPIPRTLHMSLVGIRDMSIIDTPPEDRLPVVTYVGELDYDLIKGAIERELARGGQVFYVYNRVEGIEFIAHKIQRLVPRARMAVAHGQLDETALEKVMVDFVDRKYDLLICTTIIESGLDIPSVNTMIVERAQLLGLAQLYQLRGRVGRAGERAYAYFFYQKEDRLTSAAFQRLKTIYEFTELGSGLRIAMRDLEIRGAGNILGPEQHGHIASVGFELYCQLVREAVDEIRGIKKEREIKVTIDLPVDAFLPQEYIEEEVLRIEAYRMIERTRTLEEVESALTELQDRFGTPPEPARNLLEIAKIRVRMKDVGIAELSVKQRRIHLAKVFPQRFDLAKIKRVYPRSIFKANLLELVVPLSREKEVLAEVFALLDAIMNSELLPEEEVVQKGTAG
ncbi:transcription-repair coupling factor (superfamily II helicase) [Candidatus Hakubella thermalkaliphila]|uniref:Transcription-repair-coupling factor n=2 Tax=Candidatus Hakubella thermalkaliphila TaxID=2754717 RepID=A0A6V8PQ90_9ACTN|nr:transcription-repair coupling factor [Candidatus Hakubella thermalkaliphila]GFP27432.1 transcription-repair coupling factor (superfamily II helicase) [Candidatus Hakubella thermalkaliphila]GFP34220.1 transcription-repair coupling factor (superfamily II helicase) [Candidatus Hakubella thermalkaliphila]